MEQNENINTSIEKNINNIDKSILTENKDNQENTGMNILSIINQITCAELLKSIPIKQVINDIIQDAYNDYSQLDTDSKNTLNTITITNPYIKKYITKFQCYSNKKKYSINIKALNVKNINSYNKYTYMSKNINLEDIFKNTKQGIDFAINTILALDILTKKETVGAKDANDMMKVYSYYVSANITKQFCCDDQSYNMLKSKSQKIYTSLNKESKDILLKYIGEDFLK